MGTMLVHWEPEDLGFWEREGERIARRNLALSVPALVLSFAVWMLWSAVVVHLPHVGFRFTPNQLFWLAALPGLAGGTLRLLFSFMVPIFGGRNWTAVSTALLLLPAVGLALAVQDPHTGYPTFVVLAVLCGIGGGNFASSMANVSLFYPTRRKGAALGLNAGVGNLGIGLAQLAVPLVIAVPLFGALAGGSQRWSDGGTVREVWLQNAGLVWVPLIALAALSAWRWMDNIAALQAGFAEQAVIFARKHNWLLSWLYLGTFGSFIGYAAGFPLLAEVAFGADGAASYAFVGPLVGAVARPLGGWLADRSGGARLALACFAAMAAATLGLLLVLPEGGQGGSYGAFLALFALLFAASGLGNGAVFHMIPAVLLRERQAAAGVDPQAQRRALREGVLEGAASLGFASSIAAFGGFVIPKSYGTALAMTGDPAAALYLFLIFYASCMAVTWRYYVRPRVGAPCRAGAGAKRAGAGDR
ncbi:MAG: MFS transporter [Pseudomonadota bacterium]